MAVLHKYRLYALHRHSALAVAADMRPYSPEYATHVCRHPRTKSRHNAYIGFMQHRPKDIRPILMFQYKTDYNNDVYGVYRILGVIGKVLAVVEVVLAAAAAGTAVSAATSRLSRLAAGVMLAVQGITLFYTTRLLPPSRLVQVLSGKDVGLTMMSSLMQHFYQPMLKKAREDKLPIIDMPNTFDPKAPHYISGIEPNEAGGGIIAQLIAHVVQSDDTKGESRLYAYRGNTHHNSFNRSGSWQVTDSYS